MGETWFLKSRCDLPNAQFLPSMTDATASWERDMADTPEIQALFKQPGQIIRQANGDLGRGTLGKSIPSAIA
jgi:hypothetical protein